MARFRPGGAAAALALPLLAAACIDATEPTLGGDYLGSVQSNNSVEGAALLDVTRAGVQRLSAPGRVLVAHALGADSVRVLIINDATRTFGGPVSFVATMASGERPPTGRVVQAAAPNNRVRVSIGDYRLHFTRAQAAPTPRSAVLAPAGGPSRAVNEAEITFERAAGVFFGDAQQELTAEERQHMDQQGNGDARYDIGDLRAFLGRNPSRIPDSSSWAP